MTDPAVSAPRPPTVQTVGPASGGAGARRFRRAGNYLALVPFHAYVGLFLILPTLIVVVGAFTTADGQFTLDEVKQSADAALAYEGRTADEVISVARMTTSLGRKLENRDIMVPYLELAMQVTEGSTEEKLVNARRGLRADHALFVTKDPKKAVAFKKEGMAEGWMETSDGLNSFAWWCFENRVNLEEADALARKGVTLASDGPGKAAILDTAAEICNARGNCKDAIVLIEQAIQADPGNEYYVKQRDRFRKILAES
jgi:hypothetical protein